MRNIMLRFAPMALSIVVLVAASDAIFAQSFPNKLIRIVVPVPAGGSTDIRVRIVANKLTQSLGKQVVVENRPGADGVIGTEMVARALPDGYTILATFHGTIIANPVLFRKLRYDPVNDFEHITQLIGTTIILAVNPSLPVKSVKELIALAKAKPGELNYATVTSSFYLITEMFKLRAGINMVYVPFKGDPPGIMALVSGQTPVMFDPIASLLPQIKANNIRPLAVASAKRSAILPDVPTMAESGFPGFEASTFTGFAVPAGTPREIVSRLHDEIIKIAHMPDVRDRLEGGADTIIGNTPEEFTAFIKAEIARYRNVVKEAGIPLIGE